MFKNELNNNYIVPAFYFFKVLIISKIILIFSTRLATEGLISSGECLHKQIELYFPSICVRNTYQLSMCLETFHRPLSSSTRSHGHQRATRSTIVPWAHERDGQTKFYSRFLLPCDGTETLLCVCQTECPISFAASLRSATIIP